MIAILQSSTSIRTYGLQMPLRVRTDPHIPIGRWNTKAFQTINDVLIGNTPPSRIVLSKSLARTFARNPRLRSVNIVKPCASGLFLL